MLVQHIMTRPAATVTPEAHLDEAARQMLERRYGSLVVVNQDGHAIGIVTERDFMPQDPANPFDPHRAPYLFGKNVRRHGLAAIYEEARAIPVVKRMRPILHSLAVADPVEKAMDLMVRHGVQHLPVLHNGRPVGMVSRHDLMNLVFGAPRKLELAA